MSKETPRFLYVGNHASYFIRHRLHIAKAFQSEGFEIHVAVPAQMDELGKSFEPDAVNQIHELGFLFHSIPFARRGTNPFHEINVLVKLIRLYRTVRPSIVYHATIKPVIYGGAVSRLTKIPAVLYTVSGLGYVFLAEGRKAAFLRRLVTLGYQFSFGHSNAHVFFENQDDRDVFVSQHIIRSDKCSVVKGTGIDFGNFCVAPEPEGDPVVMLPTRMLWDKGVGDFVEAASILKSSRVNARFVLVGDNDPGNPNSISHEQLKLWSDSGVVEWWGWTNEMASTLKKATLVCLPSYREGLPTAMMEGAAIGRALVATDVAGCREIVRHHENGLLVPPKDPHNLAEAFKTLLDDVELRRKFAKRARQIVETEFSADRVAQTKLSKGLELLQKSVKER